MQFTFWAKAQFRKYNLTSKKLTEPSKVNRSIDCSSLPIGLTSRSCITLSCLSDPFFFDSSSIALHYRESINKRQQNFDKNLTILYISPISEQRKNNHPTASIWPLISSVVNGRFCALTAYVKPPAVHAATDQELSLPRRITDLPATVTVLVTL